MALPLTEPNEGRLELTPEAASQVGDYAGRSFGQGPQNHNLIDSQEGGRPLPHAGQCPGQMAFLIVSLATEIHRIGSCWIQDAIESPSSRNARAALRSKAGTEHLSSFASLRMRA